MGNGPEWASHGQSRASRGATRGDVRRALAIVEACRALGDDATLWRTRAMEGLMELLPASVAIGNEIADLRLLADKGWKGVPPGAPARSPSHGPIRLGFTSRKQRAAWERYAEQTPVHRTPEFTTLLKADTPSVTRLRRQIWDDASWYRSRTFNEIHKEAGLDDSIISICRIPGTQRSSSIWVHRALGAEPFGRREWYLLDLAHRELTRLIGGPLASTLQATPATLTKRQRVTLELLLAGMTEKQAASEMGVGTPTVHEFVQGIYRHFGVHSRAELLAHFIRRYRGAMNDVRVGEDDE